jgi:hypothetical protein
MGAREIEQQPRTFLRKRRARHSPVADGLEEAGDA